MGSIYLIIMTVSVEHLIFLCTLFLCKIYFGPFGLGMHFANGMYALFSYSSDVEMETDHYSNGFAAASSNGFLNGSTKHDNEVEECDTEMGLQ